MYVLIPGLPAAAATSGVDLLSNVACMFGSISNKAIAVIGLALT